MWGLNLLEQAGADLRFAVRRLRTRPGFSLATIAVTALGIGATTAVFSAVDAALFRPLPFAHPSELYIIHAQVPLDPGGQFPAPPRHQFSVLDAAAMRDVFSHVAVYAAGGLNLKDTDNPQRLNAGVVSQDFFHDARCARAKRPGRSMTRRPDRAGRRPPSFSDALWRTRFGGADRARQSRST